MSNSCDKFGHPIAIQTPYGLPYQYFFTANGDPMGNINLNGDYSSGPADFYVEFLDDFYAYSILVNISDDDKFVQEGYGALAAGVVANGVKFFITGPGGVPEIPLLSGIAITKNYHWSLLTPDIQLINYEDTLKAARTLLVEFNMLKEYGTYLRAEKGQRLMVRLNDNFSGLIAHTFGVRGIQF
ncbi:MAG: hypothetical protein ACU84J_01885 [Gammaproteobacteria bacterium]